MTGIQKVNQLTSYFADYIAEKPVPELKPQTAELLKYGSAAFLTLYAINKMISYGDQRPNPITNAPVVLGKGLFLLTAAKVVTSNNMFAHPKAPTPIDTLKRMAPI